MYSYFDSEEDLFECIKDCYKKGLFTRVRFAYHHKGTDVIFDKKIEDNELHDKIEEDLCLWWWDQEFEKDGTLVFKLTEDDDIDYDYIEEQEDDN